MPDEDRILDLLAEIDYQRERGNLVTPEELCPGEAELCAALRRRLRERAAVDCPSTSASRPPHTSPLPLLKGYTITEQLGQGRLGIVYLARPKGPGEPVAVRLVLCAAVADRPRLRDGLEALVRCRHPHLVGVLAWGRYEGCPYLVLECCRGGDLARRLAGRPLPPGEAADLVARLARALHHAHQCGLVHGHLTPSDVLFREAEPGGGPLPKIAGTGLVPLLEAVAGPLALSAAADRLLYRAPERGGDVAADVYALGAILHECLTGRPPGGDVVSLPPGVGEVCRKCLERDAHLRYATAGDLADALARCGERKSEGERRRGGPAAWWRGLGRAAGTFFERIGLRPRRPLGREP